MTDAIGKIVVVDCETTGTNPLVHEVWEVAAVTLRPEDFTRASVPYLVRTKPQRLEAADPKALEIGGYWERGDANRTTGSPADIERLTRGRRIASCNIAFDSAFLRGWLKDHGLPATWHYSPIDIKSVCYGVAPQLLGARTDDLIEFFLPEGAATHSQRHTATYDAEIAGQLLAAAVSLGREQVASF